MKLYLIYLAVILNTITVKADFTADIFELESNQSKKILTMTNQIAEKNGFTESTTIYKDTLGNSVLEERSQIKGSELIKFDLEQKQIGASATVENNNGKIYFKKIIDGKVKNEEEKRKGDFVISATLSRYVKEKWPEIQTGKEISFRVGSWERMETVGFEIKKISEEKIGDQMAVVIQMKPSSFIIARLVKPLTFKFAADGSRLLEMKGRVAPKQKNGNDWKDLDAEIVYHYAK